MVDGILLIDKHAGPTSHDIVDSVRRIFGQKRVGHTGTLDPSATGLLVIVLGRATRLAPWLQQAGKVYEGTIRLGTATQTFDAQGAVTAQRACAVSEEQVEDAAEALTGEYDQMPPAFSAIKVNGAPAYAAARKGVEVELKPRRVAIDAFDAKIVDKGDYPLVAFEVSCSSGTYIRTLAVDFGAKMGCLAHIESLRRLSVGKFAVKAAKTIDELALMDVADLDQHLVSMRDAIDFTEVYPDALDIPAVRNGVEVSAKTGVGEAFEQPAGPEAVVKIVHPDSGQLIGLGKLAEGGGRRDKVQVKPFLVFASK